MPPEDHPRAHDAPTVLAALLHRLASPLGAIANYVHVLPSDELGLKDGLLDAVGRTSRAMDAARGWIDAAQDLAAHPAEPVELTGLVDEAVARIERPVTAPTSAATIAAREGATRWILGALFDEAAARWPEGGLSIACDASEDVRVLVAPETARASAATVEKLGDEGTLADALAQRMGGDVAAATTPDGRVALAWTVPAWGGSDPARTDTEEEATR